MKVVMFIGLQAAGKSSFYFQQFRDTHIRINLDMLKTRHREKILFEACLQAKQPVVIDNTNPTVEERKRYIIPARKHRFEITGYYFDANLESCLQRNQNREKAIPPVGLYATDKKLEIPSYVEGFDFLYSVSLSNNLFIVREWNAV